MWNERLTRLLKECCELGGCATSQDQLMQSGALLCDDVAFTLLPAVHDAFGLRVFAQFGATPPAKEKQIWRRLLEINLLMPQMRHERLGIDPATGCVIFSYVLSHPSASELIESLRHAASHARAWRLSHFLDDEPDTVLAQTGG